MGLPFGRGDLAGLEQDFKAAQVFADLLRRLLAEQPGDDAPCSAGRWPVLDFAA